MKTSCLKPWEKHESQFHFDISKIKKFMIQKLRKQYNFKIFYGYLEIDVTKTKTLIRLFDENKDTNKDVLKKIYGNYDFGIIFCGLVSQVLPEEYSSEEYYEDEEESSHDNVIIINKYLKDVEVYEPHGITRDVKLSHKIKKELKRLFITELPDYKYYDIGKTGTWHGIQTYEKGDIKGLDKDGFCSMWSLFLAELRMKYYYVPRREYREMLQKLVVELKRKYNVNISDKLRKRYSLKGLDKLNKEIFFDTGKLTNPFAEFIYEYMLFYFEECKDILKELVVLDIYE